MQYGDLAESRRESLVIVLEGVLCHITEVASTKRRFRRDTDRVWHFQWHEVPLKRMISIRERYPAYELGIVTFLGDSVCETAADYLNSIEVGYDSIETWDLESFAMSVRFRPNLRAVYDSDLERLDHYSQVGVAVMRGADW